MVILSIRNLNSKSEIEFKLPENNKKYISGKLKKVLSDEEQMLVIDTDNGKTEFIIPNEVLKNSIINITEVKENKKRIVKTESKIVELKDFLKAENDITKN